MTKEEKQLVRGDKITMGFRAENTTRQSVELRLSEIGLSEDLKYHTELRMFFDIKKLEPVPVIEVESVILDRVSGHVRDELAAHSILIQGTDVEENVASSVRVSLMEYEIHPMMYVRNPVRDPEDQEAMAE